MTSAPRAITTLHGTDITLIGLDDSYFDIVKFSIELSDGVTAVSDSLAADTRERFSIERPIRVIKNFVDTEEFSPERRDPAIRDLPPMTDELRAFFAAPRPRPDWSDRAAIIDYVVETARPFAGSHPFDEAAWRSLAARDFDRCAGVTPSTENHFHMRGGEHWRQRLGDISAPTLVVVGDDDMISLDHSASLYAAIPNAQLAVIPGASHAVPLEKPDLLNRLVFDFLRTAAAPTMLPIRRAAMGGSR